MTPRQFKPPQCQKMSIDGSCYKCGRTGGIKHPPYSEAEIVSITDYIELECEQPPLRCDCGAALLSVTADGLPCDECDSLCSVPCHIADGTWLNMDGMCEYELQPLPDIPRQREMFAI